MALQVNHLTVSIGVVLNPALTLLGIMLKFMYFTFLFITESTRKEGRVSECDSPVVLCNVCICVSHCSWCDRHQPIYMHMHSSY